MILAFSQGEAVDVVTYIAPPLPRGDRRQGGIFPWPGLLELRGQAEERGLRPPLEFFNKELDIDKLGLLT